MLTERKLINPEIRIENTNYCNAHCIICPRGKMTRQEVEMGWGTFCSLVDQAIDIGVKTVSVFGYGEPLMDKGLEAKIQYCSDKKLNTWITTNASLLTVDRACDLIGAGLKNIRFSLHAISPLNYEKVHRRLNWIETIRNFTNFLQLNKKKGNPVTVHISCIPMNGEGIQAVIDTWGESVDYLEIWKPHNWGGKKRFRKSNPKKKTCGRPFNGPVQVQSDGSVIPCCFLTDGEVILGNTHNETLLNILTGKKYEQFRSIHRAGYFKNVPCETCDQRNIEEENPLLYSSRDPDRVIGKTSTCKVQTLAA